MGGVWKEESDDLQSGDGSNFGCTNSRSDDRCFTKTVVKPQCRTEEIEQVEFADPAVFGGGRWLCGAEWWRHLLGNWLVLRATCDIGDGKGDVGDDRSIRHFLILLRLES
ncbi:hypothetical protein F0562_011467 [Nyssa sinensis]|uniref:Uncharacterized protein n=1 Tax=Nyssa sinensis TaxID=561372 RepID=A0A5J5A3X2_9ASTE|nr:hypothetical protein F0562_011467 [Nyssa sinensis]